MATSGRCPHGIEAADGRARDAMTPTIGDEVPVEGEGRAIGLWLDEDTIAWPAREGTSHVLYYAAEGGMRLVGSRVEGADGHVALTVKEAGLTDEHKARDPYITAAYAGSDYLALTFAEPVDAPALLRGQLEVLEVDATGQVVAYSGLQTARVLDALYGRAASRRRQGVIFRDGVPSFSLWAPTARSVTLRCYASAEGEEYSEHAMALQADGSWTLTGRRSWVDRPYLYEVEVYVPVTAVVAGDAEQEAIAGTVRRNLVTDPNAVGLTVDSRRCVAVDLDDERYMPEVWTATPSPPIASFARRAILELHVRDFSATDASVPAGLRGTYAAFGCGSSNGMAYLRELRQAGMNTIHLLPTYDAASIPEERARQQVPDIPTDAPPDSQLPQAAVAATAAADAYNWGYDPFHYTTPEGSYAIEQYGGLRTAEYRRMVGHLHAAGYQVVQDVVFNHTYTHGQGDKSVLDRIVPGYYHRLGREGQTLTSPCSAELATEHAMAEALMIDSLVTWARAYRVDGFRFDLMGFHSVDTMRRVRAALDGLTLEADGVDGRQMYLYGEGWSFGTTADGSRFAPAVQGAMSGTGIGTFNDRLRDAVRGAPAAAKNGSQGLGNGLATDPNGVAGGDADALRRYADAVRIGLAGNLADVEITAADGRTRTGSEVEFNGQAVGYASQPHESINYVDAHDDETLYDINVWRMPPGSTMDARVRMNTLSLAAATLGQCPVFWHAGTDLLRSKSMDRNSYDSGDWFNAIDWTGTTSNFGVGLPPAAENAGQWPHMAPFLADPSNRPGRADIRAAHEQALDLLRLRSSTPLLTLGDADAIVQKVSFPNAGPASRPGLIVMRIDDTVGEDADPLLDGLLVVFNATPEAIEEPIEGAAGLPYELSPVQARGADPVVKQTRWDAGSGAIAIAPRTVAVLTLAQGDGEERAGSLGASANSESIASGLGSGRRA
ncbi:MAG: pullulanase-type alpha-1,6-glucosidase [Actinomycetaceae bacterium]|nr:pullulanase-type alpha-1,6-glucosidase [Actinomycetaceae bacterium]